MTSQGLHTVTNYIKICTFNNYEIIALFQFVIYYIDHDHDHDQLQKYMLK